MRQGLGALRGNAEKYISLLTSFIDTHVDSVSQLRALLAKGELTAAQHLAHAIKGTAATLGATGLAAGASDLENLLRLSQSEVLDQEAVTANIEAINHALIAIAATLPATVAAQIPADIEVPTPQVLKGLLAELDVLLAKNDTAAIVFFDSHADALHAALGEPCVALAHEIKKFSFEPAREILRKMILSIDTVPAESVIDSDTLL
ncbi:MAG: Hpt domain-containing protein [Methylotenera sp.]|nr:Hpt domain-containing protein [Methylotenera sp.]